MTAETILVADTNEFVRRITYPMGAVYKREAVVDFAELLAASEDGFEALDVLQLFTINDVIIIGGGIDVEVASNATTLTFDWDIGASDTYGNGIDGNTVANTITAMLTTTAVATEDTMDLTLATLTGTLTTGRVRAYVWLVDTNTTNKLVAN